MQRNRHTIQHACDTIRTSSISLLEMSAEASAESVPCRTTILACKYARVHVSMSEHVLKPSSSTTAPYLSGLIESRVSQRHGDDVIALIEIC